MVSLVALNISSKVWYALKTPTLLPDYNSHD